MPNDFNFREILISKIYMFSSLCSNYRERPRRGVKDRSGLWLWWRLLDAAYLTSEDVVFIEPQSQEVAEVIQTTTTEGQQQKE